MKKVIICGMLLGFIFTSIGSPALAWEERLIVDGGDGEVVFYPGGNKRFYEKYYKRYPEPPIRWIQDVPTVIEKSDEAVVFNSSSNENEKLFEMWYTKIPDNFALEWVKLMYLLLRRVT